LPPTRVVVVPHTHWDREWYEIAARFRQRLVPVVDQVLDLLERDAAVRCFLLDGQAAILDDYLHVRPERRGAIDKLARAGRLLLGPWYVLSDELLPADETLVRNLLVGRRVAGAFGAWLPVGYSPDAFGHPAALPTILSGFGIANAIVWRGYGGEPGQGKDLFRWIGPDGSQVLVHHLSPGGYEFGAALPTDKAQVAERWRTIKAALEPRAAVPVWLLLNGADHHAPQHDIVAAVHALGQAAPGVTFAIGSPAEYFATVGAVPRAAEVRGELRFSYRYTWTLQGVHSTRARMKQAIAESERLLLRWAEPQAALAQCAGGADRRALLDAAWKEHLLSTAHDSLGGCVADPVAVEIATRAAGVSASARGLLVDALHERLGQDRARARGRRDRWSPSLAVINPSAHPRGGVLETTVSVYLDDVIVGRPDSRPGRPRVVRPPVLLAPDGTELPMQVLSAWEGYERLDSPQHYPDQDQVGAFRVAVQMPEVPAFGVSRVDTRSRGETPRARLAVSATHAALSGGGMEVSADPAGGFALRSTDGRFGGLGQVVSERDGGDTYSFQPVIGDQPLAARWSAARVVWVGPLVAAMARDFSVGDRVSGTVYARLDAGSSLVRFTVEGVNKDGHHRLRMLWPLPGSAPIAAAADMAYGPVMRERREVNRRRFPKEWPVATAPFHRYVSARGPRAGLTVFARGCYEYELSKDGTIAVTLFRAVRDLSRGDLAARLGHAGWPVPTPLAQELGAFRVEAAFVPRGVTRDSPPTAWDQIALLAEEFHAPLAGLMLRYGIDVPASVPGPALVGEGLAFKALKPRDKGAGLVLRCVNQTLQRREGEWVWPKPVKRAIRARLDETPINDVLLTGEGRRIAFAAGPREVVTILVEP
jgi:alpha-mannosidase